jgi:hypothetical protein
MIANFQKSPNYLKGLGIGALAGIILMVFNFAVLKQGLGWISSLVIMCPVFGAFAGLLVDRFKK